MYDLIIVGAGPAGMTATLYALRAKMNLLVIDRMGPGGQAMIIDRIDNFPGFAGGSGSDWSEILEKQLKQFNCNVTYEDVTSIVAHSKDWIVRTSTNEFTAHTVICATGAQPKKLNIQGEQEFIGKGVSYCATCDGAFFKDKHIVVVGGGDTAVKDALFLTRFGKKVTVIHRRDRLRAEKILQDQLRAHEKVTILWNSAVEGIQGAGKLQSITVTNLKENNSQDLLCDGIFILVGIKPATDFVKGIVRMNNAGFIKTNQQMGADKPGFFAAGDCRDQLLRQVVTACGDGATAAFAAQHYVDTIKGTAYGEFKKK